MPLLLDTCAAIWIAEDSIAQSAIDVLGEAQERGEAVHISAITAWEVALMAAKGRLASPLSPLAWFEGFAVRRDVRVLELSPPILVASCFLPGPFGKDPADRIIVASARELGLTVMTRDKRILNYAKAGYVFAVPC